MINKKMEYILREGSVLYGLCSMYPASGIIEGMCRGWDFVWIDGQHGEHSNNSLFYCAQAARALNIHYVIRAAGHDSGMLGLYADMAPSAIMIPMVSDALQAESIVKALRFPPVGERSYGGRLPIDLYGRDYYKNESPLIIAQIENERGLAQADEIASVEGIDALFFGPDDMKLSKNYDVNTRLIDNEFLIKAAETISRAAHNNNKYCGTVAILPNERTMLISMGYQLIVAGGDAGFLRAMSQDKLTEIQNEKITMHRS